MAATRTGAPRHHLGQAQAAVFPARVEEQLLFVIADYIDGVLAEVPLECPLGGVGAPCDVVRHSQRSRRTGPLHAVTVCRCHAHGLLFSVYPPGFVPYARQSLEATTACDAPSSTDPDGAAGGSALTDPFRGPGCGLGRALAAVNGARLRETVAVALSLPLRLVAAVSQATNAHRRAQALMELLGAVGEHGRLLIGALAGRWGVPFRWHRSPQRLQCLVPVGLVDYVKASTTSKDLGSSSRRTPPADTPVARAPDGRPSKIRADPSRGSARPYPWPAQPPPSADRTSSRDPP